MAYEERLNVLLANFAPPLQTEFKSVLEDLGYSNVTISKNLERTNRLLAGNLGGITFVYNDLSGGGLDIIKMGQTLNVTSSMVMVSGSDDSEALMAANELGIYGDIRVPFDKSEIKICLERYVLDRKESESKHTLELGSIEETSELLGQKMVGMSAHMREVYRQAGRYGGRAITVLILGPTGSGKSLVAERIHAHSSYRYGPFVKVNIPDLPPPLIESELFGHERGAFTGAFTQHRGRFEEAHRGTLFLDEIAELGLSLQSKLLGFLDDRKITRVGGSAAVEVDTRILAATNRNLEELVGAGKFREDLLYRLNVAVLRMPDLSAHQEDVPLLVHHFLATTKGLVLRHLSISNKAMERLVTHTWPGNVRQLKHAVERAGADATGGIILRRHLDFLEQGVKK